MAATGNTGVLGNMCADDATANAIVTCNVLVAGAASLVAASLVASAALAF